MATLYLVSTPIGNLGDLSARAVEVLGSVDLVLAEDTRRTGTLLHHAGLSRPLASFHAHNEEERLASVLERLEAGESLALVSDAGTPLISDPGAGLVRAVVEAGHTVAPIPGPSAVLAALVGSGLPAGRFAFLGFPRRKGPDREADLQRVALADETTVLFESPERTVALLRDLAGVCGPERRCAVARELTKLHEEFIRGTLAEVATYYEEHPPRGEVVVVVDAGEPAETASADEEAARLLARALLDEGLSPSRAAKEVARRLGVSRNDAYRWVQELD